MYKLEYFPIARKDLLEIADYISHTLKNPTVAERVVTAMVEKGEQLRDMPYLYPVYTPIRPLNHEFRRVKVGNYLMFYWVDELQKMITVARIIYSKRDYKHLL